MSKLSIGMEKQKALSIMEQKTVVGYYYGTFINIRSCGIASMLNHTVSNPYRTEILQGEDKTFELLYYYTDIKSSDKTISDHDLTPLVFDEGILIGWGWNFLNANIKEHEIKTR